MTDLIEYLVNVLKEICPETYYEHNPAKVVTYPYLTFDLESEWVARQQEKMTLDVDLFDYGSSYSNLWALEQALKDSVLFKREITEKFGIIWAFNRSRAVPVLDKQVKRRTIELTLTIDWRY